MATKTPPATTVPSVSHPERTIALIAGLIVLVVALAIIAALTLGNQPAATYPAGSPEAAFQGYVVAVDARQAEVAYGSFSQAVRRQMTLDQYQKEYGPSIVSRGRDERLRIDRVELNGDRATLFITTEHFYGGGLSSGRSTSTYEVRLVREAGDWKIDERLSWVR